MTKRLFSFLAFGVCLAPPAPGALIFTIGTVGTTAGANNWPPLTTPNLLVDDNASTRYLNFAERNTGYIFTLLSGAEIVTGINLTTANDSENRDPASFRLFGSSTVTASAVLGTSYNVDTSFTEIASGPLTLPSERLAAGSNITFPNVTPYKTFLLVFPTVKDGATANSMHIAEARLQTYGGALTSFGTLGGGQLVPEPHSALLAASGALWVLARRRRNATLIRGMSWNGME